MIVKVKVKPRASRNEVKKVDSNLYEVKTTSVAEDGKANQKVLELLAEFFKVPKSRVCILRGLSSRYKEVQINL